METKFKEVILRTDKLEEIKGKFIAERLVRKWEEDFVDEDTSEVVNITRSEFFFEKGTFIDDEVLTQLNFYFQSQSIKDVLVSNQKRTGYAANCNDTAVFCVTIKAGKKNKKYYLYSKSIDFSLKVANDFLEQKIDGSFHFVSVKVIGFTNLISFDEDYEENTENEKDFYNINIKIAYEPEDFYYNEYVLQANDAEEAKAIITNYVSERMVDAKEKRTFETTIISAKTISINNIIDYKFVKEYYDNYEVEED